MRTCVFQPANSNKSQVTLRNVDYGLSGTFSCEVTADAPTFSTASVSKNLTVVCKYMLRGITRISRNSAFASGRLPLPLSPLSLSLSLSLFLPLPLRVRTRANYLGAALAGSRRGFSRYVGLNARSNYATGMFLFTTLFSDFLFFFFSFLFPSPRREAAGEFWTRLDRANFSRIAFSFAALSLSSRSFGVLLCTSASDIDTSE